MWRGRPTAKSVDTVRIGLIVYGSLATTSGGYLYDRRLVAHLQSAGEEVEVISLPWRRYAYHLMDNFSASLYRQLRRTPFDVLLQDELNHPSLAWLNRYLRRRVGYPIVSIVHHLRSSEAHPAPLAAIYRRVERAYLASVDGFICNSHTTRRVVEALIGAGRPTVVAVPGADHLGAALTPQQIAERVQAGGPLRVLFVGNLIPRKGLHILLEALARLSPDLWHLMVVGSLSVDPPYVRAVQRRIERLGLAERVRLTGALEQDDLIALFCRSDVLAVPSSYEGYGIVYVEGMAFGLPAIATTAGAAAEIVTHGHNGFLVPAGDVEALSACLQALASNRERLLAMSLAAREHYAHHPTWAETATQAHRFLKALVDASLHGLAT